MASVHQVGAGPTPAFPAAAPAATATATNGTPSDGDMDTDSRSSMSSLGRRIGSRPQKGDPRIAVIMYNRGQENVVSVFADVLGKPFRLKAAFGEVVAKDYGHVIGVVHDKAKQDVNGRDRQLVVAINAHCVDLGMPPDAQLSASCDYEFLYTESPFSRRDLARFISFTLGQISPHESLMTKSRTYFISTTFPDVSAALPNLDILTVGSDAVEIRVDLLKEPLGDGDYAPIPSLSYVGQQVMLLRQRTELPIIFTTRCTRENGRFPMENPYVYSEYLYRAIQWGVEYIDVELWLPEAIRKMLWEKKGNSRIMSAFHDFSGTFRWTSPQALAVFRQSREYADIVKMIAIINEPNENFELEYFRSKIRDEFPGGPPLSAVNMGETGQFSRTLNRVFTPITHPLLPIIAAPGQMSAAEINNALALLGQLPKKNIYGIHSSSSARIATPQAPFYEKCFNELGLPHHFAVVERQPNNPGCMEAWCNQKNFGGAYLTPPVSHHGLTRHGSFFASLNGGNGPILSEAAKAIGMVDTIVVRGSPSSTSSSAPTSIPSSPRPHHSDPFNPFHSASSGGLSPNASLVLDNSTWRGVLCTLTKDLAPSAYFGRTAVVIAGSSDDAASAVFALKALKVSKIYTGGFRTPSALARDGPLIEPFQSLESLQKARMVDDDGAPFVIISALGPDKGNVVGMLLKMFGAMRNGAVAAGTTKKVFLDLADGGARSRNDPGMVAGQSGWTAYGAADVAAFTTVETLRGLVGQNVPYSFVRLAGGRGMY